MNSTDSLLSDVNLNGTVSAADILALINHLNGRGPQQLIGQYDETPRLDIDGDGAIVAQDVLLAITLLNQLAAGPVSHAPQQLGPAGQAGEGEGESVDVPAAVEPLIAAAARAADAARAPQVHLRVAPAAQLAEHLATAGADAWSAAVDDRQRSAILPSDSPGQLQDDLLDLLSQLAIGRVQSPDESSIDGFFGLLGQ
jgi:hypothetical protein